MGNNNTTVDVTFDRTQPAIYYAGDVVSGRVNFTVPERTTAVDYIFLTLTGDVGFTTMRTTRTQNGQTKRITDRHDIRIFGEKVVLGYSSSSPQPIRNGRINDTTVLPQGQYSYPFAIRLPDILPPTIHPTDYPFVRYELQLIVEKKWYCSNSRFQHPLRVYPRVNLLHISNSRCAIKFNTKRKDIIVKGIIQHSGLVPGEQTIISLEIHNPNHLAIKRVDVCFLQRYDIEQSRRRLELFRLSIPQITNTDDEHIQTTCPITIPLGISPTYNYKKSINRSAVHVNIHYDIKIEVKAKGLFSDFELQVPMIIGTDSEDQSNAIDMMTATASAIDFNAIDMLEVAQDDDGSPSES